MIKKYCTRDDGKLRLSVYLILFILPLVCAVLALSMGRMKVNISEIINLFKNYIYKKRLGPYDGVLNF